MNVYTNINFMVLKENFKKPLAFVLLPLVQKQQS